MYIVILSTREHPSRRIMSHFMTILLSPTHCSHIGDEWLVTVDDTESYIPDVTEVSSHPVTTFTRLHPLPLTTGSCQGGQPDNSEGSSVLCGSGSDWSQWEASTRPQGGEDWTQDLLPPSRYVHVLCRLHALVLA